MAKPKHCGICCIESTWNEDHGEVPAVPTLRTLAKHHGVPFKKKTVKSSDRFLKWLKEWTELDDSFGILYVSSHGFPGGISLPDANPVWSNLRLPQMADLLEEQGANNGGCIVHFGSCSTQRTTVADFDAFRSRSGFEAVSGYNRDIDWIKSLAFDMLYLNHAISNSPPSGLSAEYMEDVHCELRERSWYGLGYSMGFHIETGVR